jgi:hypothetical protein
MNGHHGTERALSRIAELLVLAEAKVGLNEIAEVLNELAEQEYRRGYDDGVMLRDDRENEAAELADARRLSDF